MMNSPSGQVKPAIVHPLWLRICHWVNALSILIMVTSGWRIYNASPLFNFDIPDALTLGGWLAGALQWHFSAMWLFALNGVFYLLMNVVSGRLKKTILAAVATRGHSRFYFRITRQADT